MKKILLTIALFGVMLVGKSQTVLNELYTDPGSGHSEFFELYNSSTNPAGQSVDCFTILTWYDNNGTDKGWYVMDLPNLSVGPKGYFVGAAASPFNTQSTTGSIADFNWNDVNFRNGSTGGFLKKFQVNGSGYTDVSGTIPSNFNNFLPGGNGKDYIVLVYVNNVFSNGFIGGSNSGLLINSTMGSPLPPTLSVTTSCGLLTADFNALGAMENVISQPGNDNGYARTSDGKCGAWDKTSSSVHHTPGTTNGSAAGIAGSLTTAPEIIKCRVSPGTGRVIFQITGFSGAVTLADDFPVEVQVYTDYDSTLTQGAGNGKLDQYDTSKGTRSLANINIVDSVDFTPGRQPIIVVYKTKRGCFDKVVAVPNGCTPLPVNFTYFTAKRTSASSVNLSWQTSFELNNAGFSIERSVSSGSWEQVAFVSAQTGGNSNDALSYQYVDMNSSKGITQYRIKQVDINGKYYFTDIRAVRGIDQAGKTIVYPNPSFDGKVNVVFEDASAIRDVSLIDMSGRILKQWNGVSNNNIQIDNLVPGFYSLRVVVRETGAQSVEKIVINKR